MRHDRHNLFCQPKPRIPNESDHGSGWSAHGSIRSTRKTSRRGTKKPSGSIACFSMARVGSRLQFNDLHLRRVPFGVSSSDVRPVVQQEAHDFLVAPPSREVQGGGVAAASRANVRAGEDERPRYIGVSVERRVVQCRPPGKSQEHDGSVRDFRHSCRWPLNLNINTSHVRPPTSSGGIAVGPRNQHTSHGEDVVDWFDDITLTLTQIVLHPDQCNLKSHIWDGEVLFASYSNTKMLAV